VAQSLNIPGYGDIIQGVVMKSIIRIVLITLISSLMLCPGLWAGDKKGRHVDAYSSASDTKTLLAGPALDAVAKVLQAGSSELATAAEARAPGYEARRGIIANVMSTNPNGSIGMSTISEWGYARGGEADTVQIQLTEGQNALNLASLDRRGTLFIPELTVGEKAGRYFVHFKVIQVDTLAYSDEAYEAGKFNSHYSGAAQEKSQFTLTGEVLAVEEVSKSVKLGFQMP
jgi:hypothetical protein